MSITEGSEHAQPEAYEPCMSMQRAACRQGQLRIRSNTKLRALWDWGTACFECEIVRGNSKWTCLKPTPAPWLTCLTVTCWWLASFPFYSVTASVLSNANAWPSFKTTLISETPVDFHFSLPLVNSLGKSHLKRDKFKKRMSVTKVITQVAMRVRAPSIPTWSLVQVHTALLPTDTEMENKRILTSLLCLAKIAIWLRISD